MSVAPISSATSSAAALAAGGKPQALRNLPQGEQVKAAAGQFEAIILRQLLQDSVGKIMGEGPTANVYGYLLTDQLANSLSQGGGLGLAPMLTKQLSPRTPVMPETDPKELP
jgi:peptidoglycan hydrolase FlgJ